MKMLDKAQAAVIAIVLAAAGAATAQPYGQNLNGAYDARGTYTSLDRGNATATGPNTGRTDALGQPASFDRADDGSLAALFAAQAASPSTVPLAVPSSAQYSEKGGTDVAPTTKNEATADRASVPPK